MKQEHLNEEDLLMQLCNIDTNHIDIVEYGDVASINSSVNHNRYRIQKTKNEKYLLSTMNDGVFKNVGYFTSKSMLIAYVKENIEPITGWNWFGYVSDFNRLKLKKERIANELNNKKVKTIFA